MDAQEASAATGFNVAMRPASGRRRRGSRLSRTWGSQEIPEDLPVPASARKLPAPPANSPATNTARPRRTRTISTDDFGGGTEDAQARAEATALGISPKEYRHPAKRRAALAAKEKATEEVRRAERREAAKAKSLGITLEEFRNPEKRLCDPFG